MLVDADWAVGYDTPASVPDVFAESQVSAIGGGLTGSGFRVAGAGGLANIASILGASGIRFRPADDSDDEDEAEASISAVSSSDLVNDAEDKAGSGIGAGAGENKNVSID